MDALNPLRLAWLRSQAVSLGTNSKPVSEDRKAWLRARAVDLASEESIETTDPA